MGIQPHLQYVSEHQMVRSTVGVITNVRPDHLDEMGPTLEEVADSLCNTIPGGGVLFTTEKERLQTIQRWAEGIGIRFHVVSHSNINSEELSAFTYLEHKEKVALALSVCEHLGVVRKTARFAFSPFDAVRLKLDYYYNTKGVTLAEESLADRLEYTSNEVRLGLKYEY